MKIYHQKFFATKQEAQAFQKKNGGALYSVKAKNRDTRTDYFVEAAMFFDATGKEINPKALPYCIAWNEQVTTQNT